MRRLYLILLFVSLLLLPIGTIGRSLDDIRCVLEESSTERIQEKVFIHTDNSCYFVGDTLWYKAYVVRADNLHPTDMSRILYVELLSPDGLVVERQNIIVSDKGYSCGNFCLRDSLYSGYYELRAYTRWMLNFNVGSKRYRKDDTYYFYNTQMARDFFRTWDGLYSRVLPIYSKPEQAGNYSYRRMYERPKQNLQKAAKAELNATFYPEGGHLIKGVANRVAFELTDQNGAAVKSNGVVTEGDSKVADAQPVYMGRGTFVVTPGDDRMKATFDWMGKQYTFNMPKAEESGVTVNLSDGKLTVAARNLPTDIQYGLSILCRGVLKHFQAFTFSSNGNATIDIPQLPTGVNDVTVFDADGKILADRLFFINNHDYDAGVVTVDAKGKINYEPYEKVSLDIKCEGGPTLFSLAVHDTGTEEPSYDNGNIMTDLLLGSELKGFVANPAYYFATNDKAHTDALDLLMMVQGWRKYNWRELSDTAYIPRRYSPEKSMTIEGGVYKMLSINDIEADEILSWQNGVGMVGKKSDGDTETLLTDDTETEASGTYSTDDVTVDDGNTENNSAIEYGNILDANTMLGVNHGGMKKEVLVEAEISFGNEIVGSVQKTRNGGRYIFEVPPFYGTAVLNMKAYNEKDSLTKSMVSRKDKYSLDEKAYSDFFVKRDMFYPIFANKYNYYQTHAPEYVAATITDSVSDLSMQNDNHLLQNVDVKGKKRRAKRAIDFNKPAYVADAYEMYNNITDYGLSYGKFDMRQFPVQICRYLYGNMGRYNKFNIDGRLDKFTFYRSYKPNPNDASKFWYNRSPQVLYNTFKLKRLQDIRVFSDYEPRNDDLAMVEDHYSADATVDFVPIPNDGTQVSFRDRHYFLKGFNEPDAFYNPDYSNKQPSAPTDYRRTLYWNPNAKTDADGRFTATFFNNSKETRISVSAAGIAADGRLIRTK